MTFTTSRTVAITLALLGITQSASSTTYTVTVLHPIGYDQSSVDGIAGNSQVGYASNTLPLDQAPLNKRSADHAMLWAGTAASAIDLNPPGKSQSEAYAIAGNTEVGYAADSLDGFDAHAMLWHGTAASAVDLNPAGFFASEALAASGPSQVGFGVSASTELPTLRALLWNGTADSVVDLSGSDDNDYLALGVGSGYQVGYEALRSSTKTFAVMWHGTADSMVVLDSNASESAAALAVYGNTQVGYADDHATLWHGTQESEVDLHPSGYFFSYAVAASATGQVGFGGANPHQPAHALLWHGTADSVVDLHQYLDPKFIDSAATAISDDGVIAGYAEDEYRNRYAVIWTPVAVPEPAALSLLTALFTFACFARRPTVPLAPPALFP
jgi:hypothetical protein